MSVGLLPYSDYRDSGLPLVGLIPAHWHVRRLRYVSELRVSNVDKHSVDGEQPVRLCNYVDVYKRDVIHSDMPFMNATANQNEISRFRLREGDVLITKDSEDWKDIGVPAYVAGEAPDLVCGYHLAVLRPYGDPMHGHYLYWQFRSSSVQTQLSVSATGVTRFGLSHGAIKDVDVIVPPKSEQAEIAEFLAAYDRRINHFIRAKRRMIELLNEQKQAIIQRAVTRGLDPDVRLKPSGVEWLGDVPEHWVMVPNSAVLKLKKNVVGSAWSEYSLLSLTKKGVILRDMENPEGKFPASFDTYQSIEPNDLIFCLFDIDETPRAVGLANTAGMITGAYTRFSCVDPRMAEYAYLFYLAMDNGKQLKPLYTGLRKVITKSIFLSAKMPLPPLEERQEIIEHVRIATQRINHTIEYTERELSFIREYRTRLIADVVTGKLDVRGVELPALDTVGVTDEWDEDEAEPEELAVDEGTDVAH